MSLTAEYTLKHVTHWFEANNIRKAKAYLNSIQRLDISEYVIKGQVKGTVQHPYQVEVEFEKGNGGDIAITPNCSCTSGSNCKHAAALLLSALSSPRKPKPAVNPAVVHWSGHFNRS